MGKKDKVAECRIERVALADCHPHPKNDNIRNHPAPGTPEWNTLKASIAQSYYDPIVLNERNGQLVSGHLRVKVMLEDGYTHADASIVDMDEAVHQARLISANHPVGADNLPGMKDLLEDLDALNVDMDLTGWTHDALENLMTAMPPEDPPAEATPITCPECGAQFQLGSE